MCSRGKGVGSVGESVAGERGGVRGLSECAAEKGEKWGKFVAGEGEERASLAGEEWVKVKFLRFFPFSLFCVWPRRSSPSHWTKDQCHIRVTTVYHPPSFPKLSICKPAVMRGISSGMGIELGPADTWIGTLLHQGGKTGQLQVRESS